MFIPIFKLFFQIIFFVPFLLQFDVNQKHQGRTLLHIAADYGQAEVIEYLVESKNADVNVRVKTISGLLGGILSLSST